MIQKHDLKDGTNLYDKDSGELGGYVIDTKEVQRGCFIGFYVRVADGSSGLHGYTEYNLTEIRRYFKLTPTTPAPLDQ